MKTLAVVVFIVAAALGQSTSRTVYLLPMAGGLDQYLAQWLTSDHVMKVVADPRIADVVLTDRLGEAFEQKMDEIHPAAEKKDDKKDDRKPEFRASKGRGTIFMVDTKSRAVVWSDYEKVPPSNSNDSLNQEAQRIAKKLQTSNH
jgi:hypothetical protein